MESSKLSHLDESGKPRMVDVSGKAETLREATARGSVSVSMETLRLAAGGGGKKGDVLTTARLAGIMGAKRTHDLIPLCHPLPLTGIDVLVEVNEEATSIDIEATVRTTAKTGVEMEALTAVSVAALTVYDMLKAVQKDMVIGDVRLVRKSGGASGDYSEARS
jgi:cyclic pyranopterin phosphate synthase